MRGVARLFATLVEADMAEAIAGDLADGWRARRPQSRLMAATWLCWSVVAIAVWLMGHRLRAAAVSRANGGTVMSKWAADLRHAGRGLARRPGMAASIVLVLALGIGLSTAVFALADPYLLRPLPYAAPSELVAIEVGAEGLTPAATLPTIDDWRVRDDLFIGVAVASAGRAIERLRLPDGSVILISQAVSPNLFEVLGVPEPAGASWRTSSDAERAMVFLPAARGRIPDEVLAGAGPLPTMDGAVVRVAGTMPESFVLPFAPPPELLAVTPAAAERIIAVRAWNEDGTPQRVTTSPVVARLAHGVTPAAVREALARTLPSGLRLAVTVTPLRDRLAEPVRPLAIGVLAAGILVLLVCAGNVANLLLANSAWRATEMATRRALGASRSDVWRLACSEAALLVALGTAAALGIAIAAVEVAGQVMPSDYRALGAPVFTERAVAFGLFIALLVGLFGMLPVLLRVAAVPPGGAAPVAPSNGGRGWRLRSSFVAMQTCLATILTIGATLLGHSYLNLEGQRIGFDRDVIGITAVYPTGPDAPPAAVFEESADRLSRLPGVDGVAIFFGNMVLGELAEVVGRLTPPSMAELEFAGRRVEVTTRTVSPGFFEVSGLDVLQGRTLQREDDAARGVVVNRALAVVIGSDGPLLGRVLRLRSELVTIVGVVEDAFDRRFTEPPAPTIYDTFGADLAGAVTYLLRTDAGPPAYAASARRALFEVERDVIVVEMSTLGDKLSNTVRERSFATFVLILFGVAGVGVTATGLVGMVASTVARRTRDIAIRVALGARRGHIRRIVVSEVFVSAAVGIAAGMVAGRWLSVGLVTLVYGVEAGNWTTAIVSAAAMILLSALAAVVPAQRAIQMQPTRALRVE